MQSQTKMAWSNSSPHEPNDSAKSWQASVVMAIPRPGEERSNIPRPGQHFEDAMTAIGLEEDDTD
jgi:hypothetical protein